MSQRRTLILVAAIAIGALASFLVWQYVNGVKDDAYGSAKRVPVYLVKSAVVKGSYGQEAEKSIERTQIPSKFLPPNAITSLDDIRDKVAINDLVPNQIVVSDMFVDPSNPAAQASFSTRLKKINGADMTTVTISVDQVHGVAGLLQPGDFVNILATPQAAKADSSGSSGSGSSGGSSSNLEYLYQKVEILAIGQTPVPQPGEATAAAAASGNTTPAAATNAANSGMITFIVPPDAAAEIASASGSSLYLTLVARDYKPTVQPTVSLSSGTLPGETDGQLTPYGPNGAN